jgi:hypothetical protein
MADDLNSTSPAQRLPVLALLSANAVSIAGIMRRILLLLPVALVMATMMAFAGPVTRSSASANFRERLYLHEFRYSRAARPAPRSPPRATPSRRASRPPSPEDGARSANPKRGSCEPAHPSLATSCPRAPPRRSSLQGLPLNRFGVVEVHLRHHSVFSLFTCIRVLNAPPRSSTATS